MSHLTPSEFVDLLEGQLAVERARHAESCAVCQSQIEDLQDALRRSADVPQPEPSPLFWEQFSTHVSERLSAPVSGGRSQPDSMWLRPRAVFAAVGALLLVAAISWRVLPIQRASEGAAELTALNTAEPAGPESDPAIDRAWDAVRQAAEGIGWEDAQEAGIAARPGSTERAILDLNDSERQQLMSLIEEELKKAGE